MAGDRWTRGLRVRNRFGYSDAPLSRSASHRHHCADRTRRAGQRIRSLGENCSGIGPFVEAWVRVRGNTAAAKQSARSRFLEPLRRHLGTTGLGHISEIADADPPFTPRGCPFQAWSLGEFIRLDRIVLAE